MSVNGNGHASEFSNLMLVTYDCARADVTYGGRLATINRLAEHGITCLHAVSSAPLTPVSHATVFTGLQPYDHGLRHLFGESLPARDPVLAEHLQRQGFQTGAIVSCPSLTRWFGFDRGFGYFNDYLPRLRKNGTAGKDQDSELREVTMKRADVVAQCGIDWITRRKSGSRWFLFLHFFDAHWPYNPPPSQEPSRNPYEGEVQFLDKCFGRVIDHLEQTGHAERTLVIVIGDHGEDLEGLYQNDRGGPDLGHPEERGHGCLLYETTQHVPLVFSHPALSRRALSGTVGLVDLAPTVCSLLRVPVLGRMHGRDISASLFDTVPTERNWMYYAETQYPREMAEASGIYPHVRNLQALWMDSFKAIRPWQTPEETVVFNLGEDPNERQPLPVAALPPQFELTWP